MAKKDNSTYLKGINPVPPPVDSSKVWKCIQGKLYNLWITYGYWAITFFTACYVGLLLMNPEQWSQFKQWVFHQDWLWMFLISIIYTTICVAILMILQVLILTTKRGKK